MRERAVHGEHSAYEERGLLDSPSSQDSELAAYVHPRLPPESSTLLLIASDLLLGWSFERVLPKNHGRKHRNRLAKSSLSYVVALRHMCHQLSLIQAF